MRIGKYFLAALLMAAIAVPTAAQDNDKQYDVKLTVYPKQEQAGERQVRSKDKKQKPYMEDARGERRNDRRQERFDKTYKKEPAKIERVTSVDNATGKAVEVIYEREPVKIKRHFKGDNAAPARPQVKAACKGECAGECCGQGECGKQSCCGEKQCCGEQACTKGHNAQQMCPMSQCGMPMGSPGHFRDFKKMMKGMEDPADFYGDRFYIGTNALAYVALAPNINLEWRRDERIAFRLGLGGFYMPWGCKDDVKDLAGFWVTPEVRWYLGAQRSWYAGVMAQYGYFSKKNDTVYDAMYAGSGFTPKTQYHAVSLGATMGYMQRVSPKFAIDYNIGLGVSAIGRSRNIAGESTDWKAAFSATQVGISFVWQVCNKPLR